MFHDLEDYMDQKFRPLSTDSDQFRVELPYMREMGISAGQIWSVIKDCIGKDMTKISMPVIINEPLTAL